MTYLKNIVHIFFYGNIFISWTAMCMVWLTTYILRDGQYAFHPYDYFLFFGTLTLYNIHRFIGLQKIKEGPSLQDRFKYMKENDKWMLSSIIVTGLAAAYFGFGIFIDLQILFIIPVAISALYAVPIFRKRLRDVAYVKIILIALSWSWLTAYNPAILLGFNTFDIGLLSLERFLFVLAITIPFDIRDAFHDQSAQLKTVVSALGIHKSKWLSLACLATASIIAYTLYQSGLYTPYVFIAVLMTYVLSGILVYKAHSERHELYFVGLLDGLMALPFLFILFFKICG